MAQASLYHGEEDDSQYPYPPCLLMLSLDGKLQSYRFYNANWKEDSLLSEPKKLVQEVQEKKE